MSLYLGPNVISGAATNTILNAHSLLDFKWADHILNEMSWLRGDTFSWQSGDVYVAAYNHLVADYSGATQKTETVGSNTITYYESVDGHKIILPAMETTAINIYNEFGVAWYYILDTTKTRFKLPCVNPAREKLIKTLRGKGNGKTLGLTDGTTKVGLVGSANYNAQQTSLAYDVDVGTSVSGGNMIGVVGIGVVSDPKKSGIVADISDSISAYKGKKYLYFYVGDFSQSATEQTAGLNSSLFNNKADLDLSNATQSASIIAKQTVSGWVMPNYDSAISVSNTGTYTAEANGYVFITIAGGVGEVHAYVNGVDVGIGWYTNTGVGQRTGIPIKKGDTLTWNSGRSGSVIFVPCNDFLTSVSPI